MPGDDREDDGDSRALARQWWIAAADPRVSTLFHALREETAAAVRRQRPLCVASGACCRFEAFGHRLYLTGLETAWVLRDLGRVPTLADIDGATRAGTCPFLLEGLCSVHLVRPIGCRTFFCDPAATTWQQELHERCHEAIRRLHDDLPTPYRYGEWRAMLRLVAEVGHL